MTQYKVNGIEFNVGDKVRIERSTVDRDPDGMGAGVEWENSWTDNMDDEIGKEFTISHIGPAGAHLFGDRHDYGWPLNVMTNLSAAQTTSFAVGDKVKVVDDSNCSFIENGEIYTVLGVDSRGGIKITACSYHYYEASRFELSAPTAPTLKLPLAVTRATGIKVVLTASDEPGKVFVVYPETGERFEYSEADALERLNGGIWTVTNAATAQAVTDAKAKLANAKEAVAAAEAALATAEAEAKKNQYLA